MSEMNGSVTQKENVQDASADKGKGKGAATEPTTQEVSMDENESSDDEVEAGAPVLDEEDPDSMEEIDTSNIINTGRRTRGRQIDFAKAAKELPEEEEDDDDDDFEEEHEGEDSKMDED